MTDMSRTRKGARPPGYEFRGIRGYPAVRMPNPGPSTKHATHRMERRIDKVAIQDGLRCYVLDEHGYPCDVQVVSNVAARWP